MDEGFRFIDIILVAMVAAFLVHRLRNVLGRRTGHETPPESLRGPHEAREDNVIPLPDATETETETETESETEAEAFGEADSPATAGLAQVKIADPRFDIAGFLGGARHAYEIVIAAFASGDIATLRPLLNNEVYDNFEGAVAERVKRKQTLQSTLVSIKSADIIAARLKGRIAEITVKFVSEIVNVLTDASDNPVEGDPNTVREITDIWTFSRNTRSSNPNWTLIETRSVN